MSAVTDSESLRSASACSFKCAYSMTDDGFDHRRSVEGVTEDNGRYGAQVQAGKEY